MIDRRNFLAASLGLPFAIEGGAGGAHHGPNRIGAPIPPVLPELAEYEQALAAFRELEFLGIPRCWSLVREGFHPFAPERVVVLPRNPQSGWYPSVAPIYRGRVCRMLVQRGVWGEDGLGYGEEKFQLLLKIAEVLTDSYRIPHYFVNGSCRLAQREQLAATDLGGVGLLEHFQRWHDGNIAVANPPVDWWVFLLPEGVDYQSLDARPVYAVVVHVFSRRTPALELRVLGLACKMCCTIAAETPASGVGRLPGWKEVSHMDRITAARFLNQIVARCLQSLTSKREAKSDQ